jgi:hypothetical protein
MGFHQDGPISIVQGHALNLVEQHGFANAAQPCQHEALFRPLGFDATQEHTRLLQQCRSSSKLWRW